MELICSDKKNDCDLVTGEYLEIDSDSVPTTQHAFSEDAFVSIRVQVGDNLKPLNNGDFKDISLEIYINTGAGTPVFAQVIRSFSTAITTGLISVDSFYVESGEVLTIKAFSDNVNDTDVACEVWVVDINAVKLALDGLDNILVTEPTGVATTFREMIVQLWMRFFNKVNESSTQIKVYKDDDATVSTTQAHTDVGGVVTVNKAT